MLILKEHLLLGRAALHNYMLLLDTAQLATNIPRCLTVSLVAPHNSSSSLES